MKTTVTTGRVVLGLALAALAGCAADQAPEMLKGIFDAKPAPAVADTGGEQTKPTSTAAKGSSAPVIRPKEIKEFSKHASVMLEKNCPQVVQPYRLTDNFATLGVVGLKQELGNMGNRLVEAFSGSSAPKSAPDKSLASVKLAAKQLNWLPMSAEKLYGERQHNLSADDILRRESTQGKKFYPIADRMLAEVLSGVKDAHDYQFQLFILKNSTTNALALPGGYLHLDQGLLADPAQHPKAYFAIAHEVGHVLQRHETIELQSRIVDSFTVKDDLMKAIGSVKSNPQVILDHVKVSKNLFTRHHMDQELQADSCATRILTQVLPDPQLAKSIDAFLKNLPPEKPKKPAPAPKSDAERLAESVNDVVDTPIARHPNPAERQQNLRAISSELAKEKPAQGR